jgi:hypothetical protein
MKVKVRIMTLTVLELVHRQMFLYRCVVAWWERPWWKLGE